MIINVKLAEPPARFLGPEEIEILTVLLVLLAA